MLFVDSISEFWFARRRNFDISTYRVKCKCKHSHEAHDPTLFNCKERGFFYSLKACFEAYLEFLFALKYVFKAVDVARLIRTFCALHVINIGRTTRLSLKPKKNGSKMACLMVNQNTGYNLLAQTV